MRLGKQLVFFSAVIYSIICSLIAVNAIAQEQPAVVVKWMTTTGSVEAGYSLAWADSDTEACDVMHAAYAPDRAQGPTTKVEIGVSACDWDVAEGGSQWLLPTNVLAYCRVLGVDGTYGSADVYYTFDGFRCVDSRKTDYSAPAPNKPDNKSTCLPVVLATGTKYRNDVDFETADRLMRVGRFYRSSQITSMQDYGTAYGYNIGTGWSISNQWSIALAQNFTGLFSIRKADGGDYKFELQTNGTISSPVSSNWSDRDISVSLVTPAAFNGNYQSILNAGARFKIRDNDGTIVLMDLYVKNGLFQFGRIHSIQSPSGYLQTYAYSKENQISTITDSFNRKLTFTWAERSITKMAPEISTVVQSVDIVAIALPDGNRIEYTYDTINSNPKISFGSRLKGAVTKNSSGLVLDATTYHYENATYIYALTGVTDNRGVRYRTSTYDASGRVSMSEGPGGSDRTTFTYTLENVGGYDYSRTKTTNAFGKVTQYIFDTNSRSTHLLERVDGDVSANCPATTGSFTWTLIGEREYLATHTDNEGRVTSYVRDGFGRPISITEGTGAAQRVTTMTWSNVNNQPLTITEPGLRTNFTYNATGALTAVSQTDLTTTTVPYSTNGQQRVWTYTYGTGGRLTAVDGSLAGTGDRILYTYVTAAGATQGNLATVTNELGHITTINTSNSRGQPTKSTDPNGVVTDYTYDGLGRLASIINSVGVTPTTTTMTYDAVGLINRITVPGGAYLDHIYDASRRLTKITNSSNESITYTRNLLGNITKTEVKAGTLIKAQRDNVYDELGRLMRTVGATSVKNWKIGYDKNDNVVSVTDPRSKIWSYGFDSLNRLITETEPGTGTVTTGLNGKDEVTSYKDRRNLVTNYVRNGFGDTIRETNPDTGVTDYTYDSRGLVTQIKDARNVIANMTYDAAGRMLTRTFPAATTENVTFAYDSVASGNKGKGQLTQLNDPAGNSKFVYDVRGNLLSETRTIGTVAYAVKYTYDGADRLTSMTYPSGRIITYVRNASGKITGVTSKANATATALTLASNVAWQPNVAGAVSGETVFGQGSIATAVQNMAMPGDGGLGTVDLLQSLTYGNGLVLFKNFNTDNELFQLIVEQSPSTPAGIRINRFYNRADNTNITGMVDGQNTANNETYSYTDAGRLAGATSSTTASYGTRVWTYDANGNRLTETANGVLQNYYYAANNNRLSNIAQGSVSKRIFTYDAAGNVTQDLKNSTNAYNYAINNAGRIRTLSIGTTLKTTYVYDGFQRLRVKAQTAPVSTTHYIWDSFGHIIAEHASAGGVQKEYIWLGDTPLAVFEGANLYYVHPDNLDRPVMMTNNNAAQTIAWAARYDPFGNAVTITSAITNNQRLPGQWFQIEDGLAYNWHRTYDPTLGRYTQADPLGFVDGPSVYGYAGQSPLMKVDPRGQWVQFIAGGIFAGGFMAYEYYSNSCATAWDLAGAGINGFANGLSLPRTALKGMLGIGGRILKPKKTPNGPKHGGEQHNGAIETRMDELSADSGVTDLMKNKAQRDLNGNKVGNNRPDIQYTKDKCRFCIEYDFDQTRSENHGNTISGNDPNANVELNILKK